MLPDLGRLRLREARLGAPQTRPSPPDFLSELPRELKRKIMSSKTLSCEEIVRLCRANRAFEEGVCLDEQFWKWMCGRRNWDRADRATPLRGATWRSHYAFWCQRVHSDGTLQTAVSQLGEDGRHPFYGHVSTWDVSNVTSMSGLFYNRANFNSDLSLWDVSRVINMDKMFMGATSFDGRGLARWKDRVSGVTSFYSFAAFAYNFNPDLSEWDVSGAANMSTMFWNARAFDSNLSKWDVSNVVNMRSMFEGASSFSGAGLSEWRDSVRQVLTMNSMFADASNFNADLSKWNVGADLYDMTRMFAGARKFDADLSGWDVGSVTEHDDVFEGADRFNPAHAPVFPSL